MNPMVRYAKYALAALLIGGVLLTAAGCAGGQAAAAPGDSRRTITVIGTGKATARPDVAQTQIGVDIRDASVDTASAQANERVNQIIAALQGLGIADQDIQTANYNIWVEQPYGERGEPTGAPLYHVVSTLNVTIRDLSKVGQVLDAVVKSGANTISGVSFSIADPAAVESKAREQAIANAQARAKELAQLTGVQVGEVVAITEVIGQNLPPVLYEKAMAAQADRSATIQPGELETSLQVQVTYAIQ